MYSKSQIERIGLPDTTLVIFKDSIKEGVDPIHFKYGLVKTNNIIKNNRPTEFYKKIILDINSANRLVETEYTYEYNKYNHIPISSDVVIESVETLVEDRIKYINHFNNIHTYGVNPHKIDDNDVKNNNDYPQDEDGFIVILNGDKVNNIYKAKYGIIVNENGKQFIRILTSGRMR